MSPIASQFPRNARRWPLLAAALGAAWAAAGLSQTTGDQAPRPDAPPSDESQILLKGLSVEIRRDAHVAYRVEAEQGRMNQETREIGMNKPHVRIYDEQDKVRNEINGERGKVWPVKFKEKDPNGGEERELTKYDWSLEGGVDFESNDGASVKALEMTFANQTRTLVSRSGVDYRMPAGSERIFSGVADQFEAEIDPASGRVLQWTLTGRVNLTSQARTKK